MEYVVVKTGGKQYRVSKGDVIEVESLGKKKDEQLPFEDVLLYVSDSNVEIGKPKLGNVKVLAKIIDEIRGEKIRVSKFKSKVRYRKTIGHRQHLSKVKIENISIEGKKESKSKEKVKKLTQK